ESIPLSSGDKGALQDFIDVFVHGSNELSGNAFLNARQALSNMAKYDATKTNASTTMARDFRSMYDKIGKENITGLKELDEQYSGERKLLDQIKRDYLKPDGSFKDNATQKIANLKQDSPIILRLEEISPGISKQIRILNALEDIQNAKANKVGTYVK